MSSSIPLSSSFQSFSSFIPASSSVFSPSVSPSPGASGASGGVVNGTVVETAHMPLTTIFTSPASCSDRLYTYSEAHSGIGTYWRDKYGPGEGEASVCYPYSFRYQHRSTVNADYSPGVCPSGYIPASSATNARDNAWTSWCCPSGMTYGPSFGCYTTVSTATSVKLDSKSTITIDEPFVAVDWYVKVAWATAQLEMFTPASAPLIVAANATSVGSPNVGWSDDTRTAVQVGVPLGIVTIAVVAVACYALWRRKRRQTAAMKARANEIESEKLTVAADENERYDSGHATGSSNNTPLSSNDTPGSMVARREFEVTRMDSWQEEMDIDETQPIVEPR